MFNVRKDPLSVNSELYGIMQGKEVYRFTLQNETLRVEITNLGCSITSIYAPGRNQLQKNIVAGFEDIKDYQNNPHYFGCVLGRYANRIAGGRFILDEKNILLSVNDGVNHLHGGFKGFNKKIWEINNINYFADEVSVEFEYLSRDGEEGYPGNLRIKVKYILNNKNQLCIEYHAETDKATPVNLSNHTYFNLTGFETPIGKDHLLYINALSYTEKNLNNVPTGNILSVADTALDFIIPQKIGRDISRFSNDKGFDQNLILAKHSPGKVILAAQLKEPVSGRTLTIYTDQPAIQLYTANFWDGTVKGYHGGYQQHGAVALETQAFPDSPNHPSFPQTILQPGGHYFSTTIYEFEIE